MESNPITACRKRAGHKSPYRGALAAGVDPSQLAKIEKGEMEAGRETLLRLARGWNCSADELLGLREVSA